MVELDRKKITCNSFGDYDPNESCCQPGDNPKLHCHPDMIEFCKQETESKKLKIKELTKISREEEDLLGGNGIPEKDEDVIPECIGNYQPENKSCQVCGSTAICIVETNENEVVKENEIENAKLDGLPDEKEIDNHLKTQNENLSEDELKEIPTEKELKESGFFTGIDIGEGKDYSIGIMVKFYGDKLITLISTEIERLDILIELLSEDVDEPEIETKSIDKSEESILDAFGSFDSFIETLKLSANHKEFLKQIKSDYTLKFINNAWLLQHIANLFGIKTEKEMRDKSYWQAMGIEI